MSHGRIQNLQVSTESIGRGISSVVWIAIIGFHALLFAAILFGQRKPVVVPEPNACPPIEVRLGPDGKAVVVMPDGMVLPARVKLWEDEP